MAANGPFGFDPDDFDRIAREAGEGLRDMFTRMMEQSGGGGPWSSVFGDFARSPRTRPQPETTGEAGSGVWAIFALDDDGVARVDQVFPTEIDALRAHKDNTDPRRRVRFLPYGMTVSILDQPDAESDEGGDGPEGDAPVTDPKS